MTRLTENERDLLRRIPQYVGHCIADPEGGIEHLRDGHGSGGGGGFTYQFTKTAVTGQWHEWIPVAWATAGDRRPEGQPIRWRQGELLREARVSYGSLQQWCESVPAEVRDQALTWWRTYPEDTRDLAALVRLTLQQLADPEPADLLELLEVQG
ncbi:hypothetical protein OG874_00125 [Nocardia sp. NBC_00565]|uniref:hypothetical protein n=1 Tax=Nocardia sp. NBC_00565 TaxID=2975993 RepID=UPI002E82060A|nr:hypothetical protein [Nocardia sp. NBC_00565]WUC03660.1 hypothetical protein OG874_00125 [Nocardia sp. NBC_00565]